MFTFVTITGSFERPNGEPAQGTNTASLAQSIRNADEIVTPTPVLGELNAEGKLVMQSGAPFVLEATDDTGTEPAGVHYRFVLQLDNAPVRIFFAALPHATSPVDISTLEG